MTVEQLISKLQSVGLAKNVVDAVKDVPVMDAFDKVSGHAVIIIPNDNKHDSGFCCFTLVIFSGANGMPIARTAGYTDAVHIRGNLSIEHLGHGIMNYYEHGCEIEVDGGTSTVYLNVTEVDE